MTAWVIYLKFVSIEKKYIDSLILNSTSFFVIPSIIKFTYIIYVLFIC